MPDIKLKRLVYQMPGMSAAAVQRDVPYLKDGDTVLQMDIYSPPQAPKTVRLPAVVFIHGGPIPLSDLPKPKDWGGFVSYGELCAASGFVGITLNHRYGSPNQLAQAESDVLAAITFIRDHADGLNVDPDRLGLWVFSGGGPLLSAFLRERPQHIRCMAAHYAVLDLRSYAPPDAPPEIATWVKRFSPAVYIKERSAGVPLFIARAGLDHPTINQTIDLFVQEALSANAAIEVLNHPDGQHSFDIIDDNARTREITARGLEFMQRHLTATA